MKKRCNINSYLLTGILYACLLFIDKPIKAQVVEANTKAIHSEFQKLDSVFKYNYTPYLSSEKQIPDWNFFTFLNQINSRKNTPSSNKEILLAKSELLKGDFGFSTKIAYLDNQLSGAFDLDNNIAFNRRIQAGLEWDILKGGLVENRQKAKALQYDAAFEELIQKDNSNKDLYLKRFSSVLMCFNHQKMTVLNKRKSIINELLAVEENLFFAKKLPKQELLDAQLRLAEINGLIQVYEQYNNFSLKQTEKLYIPEKLSPFDLNTDVLTKNFNSSNSDSIRNILKQQADLIYKWYNELSLNSFTRYNYFDLSGINPGLNRSFLSFGLNLSIPLPFNHKKKNALEKTELNNKIIALENKQQENEEQLLNDIYDFRIKLKQYIELNYKKQKLNESLRIEETKRKLESNFFNPINAITLIDDMLQVDLEMIDAIQHLYLKLIKINQHFPELSLKEMVNPIEKTNSDNNPQETKRSIYVWSSIFAKKTPAFMAQYLIYNKFNNIILAYQQEDSLVNYKTELINSMGAYQCKTELLFGQNELINQTNIHQWFDQALKSYNLKSLTAIHLDVEPHTFENWKSNKEELLSKYLKLLDETKQFCSEKGLKLTVSLPLYYPEDAMNKIFELADLVYFMCYENIDKNYLEKKIQPFSKYNQKISLSFRTEDFKDRLSIEKFSKEIASSLKINHITLHDLNRLLILDQGEFEK